MILFLHVGMIAWLLASMLRLGGVSRVWWFPLLAPLLIVYTLGTGASASALRACIMACLFFAAPMFGRKADSWSALAGSAILILAWDPWQVLDPSYYANLAIITVLIKFLDFLAAFPYASVDVPRPPLWVLPVWYAGLVALAMWRQQKAAKETTPFS